MTPVDVVIPCYQHGAFLEEAVRSVLRQDVPGVRILVIDNASTDDSVEVARRLAAEDPRVTLRVHGRNLGLHASFNEGLDWATGDYVMVLCADDTLVDGALSRAVAVLEAHPDVGFAYGSDIHLGPEEPLPRISATAHMTRWQVMTGDDFIRYRFHNPEHYINSGMVLARTSVQKRAGHFRETLNYALDLEMLLRLATYSGVARTRAVLGTSRVLPSAVSAELMTDRTAPLRELQAVHASYLVHEGALRRDSDELAAAVAHGLAERAYWSGVKNTILGRPGSRQLLQYAVELDPRIRRRPPLGYLARSDRGLSVHVRGLVASVGRALDSVLASSRSEGQPRRRTQPRIGV